MEVEVEGHVKPLKKIDHIIAIHHDNIQNKREMAFVDDNQKLANTYDFLAQSDRFNYYIAPRSDHLGRDIQQEIEIYQSALEKAANDDEKLQAIVNLIWMCDHIHPFFDVNIRTFAITLLTRLLLQNGFPPATFEDPNRFDGFSKKEMLVEVKKAMQNTIDITNGKKDLFGFNSDAIPTAEQDKLVTNYAAEFVAAINKEYSKQAVLAIKNDIQREWSKGHTVFSNPAGDEGMPEQVTKQWQLIRQAEKNGNYEEVLQQLMETRKQAASSNLVDTTKQTHKP
jgi:hypothetical protein